ncbi:SpoIID/LytB domain-containing protein [Nocardioides campestrisoli]|uniref:SpoIID/LytB domain-containing protein n=1 Tax=Nocardioides campestrisoli TaxID=2736757 RepID=UPI0015E7BF97|nr:SpoIID/LytB domain-containing protein [Nocardioides campestrisoli]
MRLRPVLHTPARAAALAAALVLVPLGVPAATAAKGTPAPVANPQDMWSVQGAAAIRVLGKGYGHGHGMSQYGAEGAARAGLTHQQIMEFYYPGTQWGTATGKVRVHLTADTTDDVVVVAKPGTTVKNLATKKRWKLPNRTTGQWRLTTNRRNNKTIVQWRDRGSWKRWKAFSGDGELAAPGGLTLVTPSGRTTYRGKLRAASPVPGSKQRDTVNVVSLENYLKGVVPLEIPASWNPEAVRSQAVAARSYAAFERAQPLARHYQICDTTACQVYGGKSAEHPLATDAITATAGQVLTADGAPAFTQFASSNGGWSSAGSRPYLAAQADPYDGWAGNPNHTWSVTMGVEKLESAWPAVGSLQTVTITARDGNGEWGGRVSRMTLTGTAGSVEVTGDQVRSALGLKSSWFTLDVFQATLRGSW